MFMREGDGPPDAVQPEHRLEQLERMAMVGALTAGLGHDLRNLLMPALLRLDALDATPDLPDSAHADLAGIRASLTNLQRLATGLRLLAADPFDRRGEPQVTQVAAWWSDICPLIAAALPANARVQADLGDTLPPVAVSPAVLTQVCMPLMMHAGRAVHGLPSPTVTITGDTARDEVRVRVGHDGEGMTTDALRRCFESFITTSLREEYVTLVGLAMGRALLRRCGGDLTVADGPAGRPLFTMHLPVHAAASDAPAGPRCVRLALADPRHRSVARLVLSQRGLREWTPDGAGCDMPDVVIADPVSIADVMADVQAARNAAGDNGTPRLIAIGAPVEDAAFDGVVWVPPTRLGTLVDVLD